MADPTCETCPFFALATVAKGHLYNACRRRPPDAVLTIADHAWPQVDPDDVCGEHPEHTEQVHRIAQHFAAAMLTDESGGTGNSWKADALSARAYEFARAFRAERNRSNEGSPATRKEK